MEKTRKWLKISLICLFMVALIACTLIFSLALDENSDQAFAEASWTHEDVGEDTPGSNVKTASTGGDFLLYQEITCARFMGGNVGVRTTSPFTLTGQLLDAVQAGAVDMYISATITDTSNSKNMNIYAGTSESGSNLGSASCSSGGCSSSWKNIPTNVSAIYFRWTFYGSSTDRGTAQNFYVHFRIHSYTISVNANGADGGSMSKPQFSASAGSGSVSVECGSVINIWNFKSLTRTGYLYAGVKMSGGGSTARWNYYHNTFGDGSGGSGVADKALSNDTLFADQNGDVNFKNLSTTDGATVTFTVQWTPITYNLAVNLNGGSITGNSGKLKACPSGGSEQQFTSSVSLTYDLTYDVWHFDEWVTRTGYTYAGLKMSDGASTAYWGYWNSSYGAGGNYSAPTALANNTLFATADGDLNFKNLSITNDGTVTLTIQWTANKYTISLNDNNGSGGVISGQATYDSTTPGLTTRPSRTGYTFAGYYDAESGGTQYIKADGTGARTWNKAADTTLYAHWTANTYTINLNTNGGTLIGDNGNGKLYAQYSGGSKVTFSSSTTLTYDLTYDVWHFDDYITKTGYHYVGLKMTGGDSNARWGYWGDGNYVANTAVSNNTVFAATDGDLNLKNLSSTDGATVTLTVQWEANKYTIAYNGNKPSNATHDPASVPGNDANRVYDTNYNLNATAPTLTGWTFGGWFSVADNASLTASSDQYVGGAGGSVINLTSTKDGTFTVYAKWTANTYDVTYNNNKPNTAQSGNNVTGMPDPDTVTWTYDNASNYTLPAAPALTGYTFGGWYKEKACTNLAGAASASLSKPNYSATQGEEVTLWAKWTQNSYTVTYNANKPSVAASDNNVTGMPSPASVTWTYDNDQTLAGALSLTGYIFGGWYKESSCEHSAGETGATLTKPNFVSAQDATQNLYAKWTPIKYTVAYNANKPTNATASVSGTPDSDTNRAFDTSYTLNASAPTLTGWTFGGWYKETGCTNKIGAAAGSIKNLSSTDGDTVTVYAKWTANTYTVTYEYRKPDAATSSVQLPAGEEDWDDVWTYDSNATIFTAPSLTGWTFSGWKKKSDDTALGNPGATLTKPNLSTGATVYFYATWTANTYTVKYNLQQPATATAQNNNVSGGPNPASVTWTYDSNATLAAAPALHGWDFNGWYKDTDCTVSAGAGSASLTKPNYTATQSATVNLYAKWTAYTYTVSYDANTPADPIAATGSVSNTPSAQTWTYDTPKTLGGSAAPILTGWTFLGWYAAADGNTKVGNNSASVVNLTDEKGGSVTLYAHWSVNHYTVVYNANKPNNATASVTGVAGNKGVHYEETFSLAAAPSLTGWTFGGWYQESSCTHLIGAAGADTQRLTASDGVNYNLFAKWTAVQVTVTFDGQGATNMGSTSVTGTYDSALPTITNPLRTGYTFGGYYIDSTCVGKAYYYKSGDEWVSALSDFTVNTELYAKWTANQYVITFKGQNGTTYVGGVQNDKLTVTYDVTTATLAYAVRTGYTFNGYWTTQTTGGKQYFDGTGAATQAWKEAGNTNLYARWIANVYTVRYNGNKPSTAPTGDESYDVKDVPADDSWTYDENATLSAAPTLLGYTFAGWYKDAACTVSSGNAGATLTKPNYASAQGATVDLYAKWTLNVYTLTYVNLEGATATGNNPAEYTIESARIRLNNPAKTGYKFNGWLLRVYDEGEGEWNVTDTVVTEIAAASTGDVNLYASWEAITYKIIYRWQGGSLTGSDNYPTEYNIESETITFYNLTVDGENVRAIDYDGIAYPAPARTGYVFDGLYTENEFVIEKQAVASGSYGNLTLYAKWVPIVYDIHYVDLFNVSLTNDVFFPVNDNVATYTIEEEVSLSAPTATGFTFIGWYETSPAALAHETGTETTGFAEGEINDKTFYAYWEIVEYDIIYNLNRGVNGEGNPATYTIDSDFNFVAATRAGFTFGGWYTDAACTSSISGINYNTTGEKEIFAKFTFNKPVITGDDYVAVYDGYEHYLTATVSHGILNECDVTYLWKDNGGAEREEFTSNIFRIKNVSHSGTYTLEVTITRDYGGGEIETETQTKTFEVDISKASLVISGKSSNLIYGDDVYDDLQNDVVYVLSYIGLQGNDNRSVVRAIDTSKDAVTYARPYAKGYAPGNYVYTPILTNAKANDYTLSAQAGTINVAKRRIEATATQDTYYYDGTDKATSVAAGYTLDITDFYGKDDGVITATVKKANGETETDFYSVGNRTVELASTYPTSCFEVVLNDGYLNINKAPLVIRVKNAGYAYDTYAHYVDYICDADQFAVDHSSGIKDELGSVTIIYKDSNNNVVQDPTVRGTYTAIIADYTLSRGSKSNYDFQPIDGILVIDRVQVTITVEDVLEGVYTYNGLAQATTFDAFVMASDTLTCDLIYTKEGSDPVVSNNVGAIDAGWWTVTVDVDSVRVWTGNDPADLGNYYVRQDNENLVSVTVTPARIYVGKKNLTFSINNVTDAVYDTAAHEATYNIYGLVSPDTATVNLLYTDNVNAGSCAVSIEDGSGVITSGNQDNYTFDYSATGKVTIAKRNATALVVDKLTGETYNGRRHYTTVELDNAVGETSFTFELEYGDNIHAGDCTVVIASYDCTVADENNYNINYSDVGIIRIHKAEYDFAPTETFFDSVSYAFNKSYNGTEQFPTVTVLPVGKDDTSPVIHYDRGATNVDEGNVTVRATFTSVSDNYNTPSVYYDLTFSISPYQTEVYWDYPDGGSRLYVTYSAGAVLPTAHTYDIDGNVIELTVESIDTFGDVIEDAYPVWAVLPSSATNYTLAGENESCTVLPKEITARFSVGRATYDGTQKSVTATGVGVLRGERVDFDVTYNTTPINVGVYSVNVALVAGIKNYVLVGETSTTFEITKRIARVIAHDLTSEYGQDLLSTVGEYDLEGFVAGDEPTVVIEKTGDNHVGVYQLIATVTDCDNYDVRTVNGRYEIVPTAITVFINDRSQKSYTSFLLSAKRGEQNEESDWYLVDGNIVAGDDPEIELFVAVAKGDTDVRIQTSAKNDDYVVTFTGSHEGNNGTSYAMYHVILTPSYLRLGEDFVSTRVYDGTAYTIPVTNTGNGKITAYVKNKQVKNSFTEVGVYVVTFKGTSDQRYFTPDDLTVTFTILPAEIETSSEGITVKSHDESAGFGVNAEIVITKDDAKAAEASNCVDFFKKVDNFYTITVNEGTMGEVLELSVGDAYNDGDIVTVCLYDGSGYTIKEYTVNKGYIVIDDASSLQGVGIVADDSIKGLLIIIFSVVGGLFVLALVMLPLIFRGRKGY